MLTQQHSLGLTLMPMESLLTLIQTITTPAVRVIAMGMAFQMIRSVLTVCRVKIPTQTAYRTTATRTMTTTESQRWTKARCETLTVTVLLTSVIPMTTVMA